MASSVGTSHLAAALPCQDSHYYTSLWDQDGRRVVVLVAADGAGSAQVADVGAKLACQTLGKLVEAYIRGGGRVEAITRSLVARWIAGVVVRLSLRAEADGLRCQDYACTLLAAIAGETATAFLQVGDGAMVVARRGAPWAYVFWPQHGEFANTTNFITSEHALESIDFELDSSDVEEIALFTDGLENLVLRKAEMTVHAPFFDNIFQAVRRSKVNGLDEELSRALEGYLAGPVITQRTDDDKTLILATRRAG